MKIAVCDDDDIICGKIAQALETVIDKSNIDCFSCGDDLLKAMPSQKYDIVYLDVEMPGTNGLDTAEAMRLINRGVIVIFVSSYTCYVTKAFRLEAFQFLVKDELKSEDILTEYERAEERYKKEHYRHFIKTKARSLSFEIKNIVYIESQNRHLYLHTNDGEVHEYRGKLEKEAEILKSFHFVRSHESYLVNVSYIKKLNVEKLVLDIPNASELAISRRYRDDVIREFNLFNTGCSI